MKKVLAICLVIVMVASMSVNVFAARGGFVKSPSGNRAPLLELFKPKDEDCTGSLIITPFGDRDTLPEEIRNILDEAYQAILDNEDLSKLHPMLEELATGKNLAVSDLFNIHSTGCDSHENHKEFDLTLSADTLKDFVGLVYMDKEGKWQWIPDAKVVNDGKHLQFTGMGEGPYAIVVDTADGSSSSKTADSETILICGIVMGVSAVALAIVLLKGKKRKA